MKKEPSTRICQALSGPLNGAEQIVPRAELEAIAQALENGIGPITIYTDHRNHARAIEKGMRYCCRAKGKHVDIWKRVWKQISRIRADGEKVEVKWIRSHQKATKEEVCRCLIKLSGWRVKQISS